MEKDYTFVHYWKSEISDYTLQQELDKFSKLISSKSTPLTLVRRVYYILLGEKLRRAEEEIAII